MAHIVYLRPNYPPLADKPGALAAGVQAFTQAFQNGQVWVYARGGQIIDAGVNALGEFK